MRVLRSYFIVLIFSPPTTTATTNTSTTTTPPSRTRPVAIMHVFLAGDVGGAFVSSGRSSTPRRGRERFLQPRSGGRAPHERPSQSVGRHESPDNPPSNQEASGGEKKPLPPQERREDGSSEDRGDCGRRSETGLVWTSFWGDHVIMATAEGSADGRGRGWSGLRSFGGQVW